MNQNKPSKKLIVGIDLFCGAGGMTLGAEQAGVKIIYAVEKCPHAAATYHLNFPSIPIHVGDIREVCELPPKPQDARTVLFGGPPCQGFSTSNQRTRNAQNKNNWLFQEFIRLVRLWQPDWVVMENVKGITETDGGRFLTAAHEAFESAGYTMTFDLLNAVDFGVPQRRTRAFFVGSRHGDAYTFPQPTTRQPITVSKAIDDLPKLNNGAAIDELPYSCKATSDYARKLRNGSSTVAGNLVTKNAQYVLERYAHVPPGGNWADIPESLFGNYANRERCHTGIYRRLDPSKPSVVIGNFRKNMLIHPKENRGLSIREAARIQSVPDHFQLSGSIGFQQQQVGNMVPPLLARAVFSEVVGNE
jgi:DNA (cytosine-5)-methyltransferase 1